MRVFKPVAFSLLLSTLLLAGPLYAIPSFLSAWQDRYPASSSDDIGGTSDGGCQLCHRDAGGGSPWNAYGWDLRFAYRENSFDINRALALVERSDIDKDPISAESIDEINANFQPGWRAGENNSIFFIDGRVETNQLPPPLPVTTAYDFPAAVADPIPEAISVGSAQLGLAEVATGFNVPLRAVKAPGIDGSLFVMEQRGRIFRVDLTTGEKTLFHDVGTELVDVGSRFDERGLLGLAFHPDFQRNGLFYTYQSEPVRAEQNSVVDFPIINSARGPNHRSFIVEHRASIPSCNSAVQKLNNVLVIDQPQSNHNGGDLAFGADGMLYVALGDGGSANDRGPGHGVLGNGRSNSRILGSILRIDPLGRESANGHYSVPANNPFVAADNPGLDEIFAFGFRNPYRMSFDAQTGELYVGDVGQNELEEVDRVVSGGNYGWNLKEGSFHFYNPISGTYVSDVAAPGSPANLIDPVGEYDHDEGISITGGYVYRGSSMPSMVGRYVFGDFAGPSIRTQSGRLLHLDVSNGEINEFSMNATVPGFIMGFGQDAESELYVLTNNGFSPSDTGGRLLKLVMPGSESTAPSSAGESAQCPTLEEQDDEVCVPVRSSNGSVALVCL